MRRLLFWLVTLALIVMWQPAPVATAPPREAAAATLAAQGKFFCHRTFRATGWTAVSGSSFAYRETDQDNTDTTLCGYDAGGPSYRSIYSTFGVPSAGTGLNGLTALQASGYGGLLSIETPGPLQSGLTGRIGFRYYHWMADNDTCEGYKKIQMGLYWTMGSGTPVPPNHTGPLVWQGGGDGGIGVSSSQLRNKWYRFEGYLNGTYANPTGMTLILKNITDNTAERVGNVTTTCVGGSSFCMRFETPGPDGGLYNNQLVPYTQYVHHYGDTRTVPGTCTVKYSYLLVGKNLGASERIPPAIEVEGGTPPPPPPAAPSGLGVTTP
jgi:hypothetical protein